jgi:dienelactone hydrolase
VRGRILLGVAALLLVAPAASAAPAPGCSGTSWTAGVVAICKGNLAYRDYVYDDYGADTGGSPSKSWGTLARESGDQRYPNDAENSADLVTLRVWRSGDRLRVRFYLSALYEPDQTVAALAIDTDANDGTGGGRWGDLGVSSRGWDVLHTFDRGDPRRNLIEGSVPLPPGTRWRLQAVTAQRSGPVMNVAFRGTGEEGAWWEAKQAAALRQGDISEFGATVQVRHLLRRRTRPAEQPASGTIQRVYQSRYSIGRAREGYDFDGVPGRAGGAQFFGQEYHFLGRWQPVGVYLPNGPAPHGIQLIMHGYSANHASLLRNGGMQRNVAEARNRILVNPLGRGPAGFYSDYSERDVLDALADVEGAFPVDRDRVFAGGYSMGGYGTFRMAALHPHRFAGFISWVGFTGDDANGAPPGWPSYPGGAIGNMVDFVGNLRHIPGAMLYAGADELVHVWTAEEMARRFRGQGFPYVYYLHPGAEHLTLGAADDWRKESEYTRDLARVRAPARVTFRTATFLDAPQLGIRHDRAYWVRSIRPRGDGYADVDLTSRGCGSPDPVVEQRTDSGSDPVPWSSQEAVRTGSTPQAARPVLEGTLANVRSLAVNVRGACLARRNVALRVQTNGPARIALSDGRAAELPGAGTHELTLRVRRR